MGISTGVSTQLLPIVGRIVPGLTSKGVHLALEKHTSAVLAVPHLAFRNEPMMNSSGVKETS
jgi:hypothetical protein